ncbi:29154_t:CDS:10 [Gigaspora margarita]|uniref:29154_t:CDS:1 n=1 Tax=Gigaspora margarita TaxID=4874 RepID=A0ABM8W1X6_GIGMA|nr:29154_t:CDS:10 [Gigaspora margarita]
MESNSENVPSQNNERQRKVQSLNVATLPGLITFDPSSPPHSPNSPRKSRPMSMFIHPQERLASEQTTNSAMVAPEAPYSNNNMPFSFAPATNSEVDVASVNSFRTIDTNQTGDHESLSSDITDRANEPQGLIKLLCEVDGGLGIALERVKQGSSSAKASATFLKKRAAIEDEYGRMMIKLSKSMQEGHHSNDTKQGSYGENWLYMLKLHESIGENRVKFAAAIQEISEEITALYKETDKSRKNLKDSSQKHEKAIQDSEQALEKAKNKYETHSEDWERTLLQKNGEVVPNLKPRTLTKAIFSKQPKSPTQLLKMEEDARNKAATANDTYKHHLSITNAARHEYYDIHLPRMVTALKDISDECDIGLQYHLARYTYLFENTMVSDALVISPANTEDGPSMRKIVEQINNEEDYYSYVQSYGAKAKKMKNHDIPYDQYNMSEQAISIINPKNVFGVDLAEQMRRDGHEVPLILMKCTEAIERNGGLESQGIYRVSGVQSNIQKLRALFDRNTETVDLSAEEASLDVNNITSVLKLWFRELPDPLFPREMYQNFINAAKTPDEKKRVLELHECVNNLPDPNYSTLKYLMGHLHKIVQNQDKNKMNVQNLGIVFGPTLMGSPVVAISNPVSLQNSSTAPTPYAASDSGGLNDMGWQCKVVEAILENYIAIFV